MIEFITDIIAFVLGFVVICFIFMQIGVSKPRTFLSWILKNPYFHIISLSLVLFNFIFMGSDFTNIEFILFIPVIVLTYYLIVFVGFIIYWVIQKRKV